MRHLPPLAAVRVFEAAARHENFTVAANELGMTQAAVSYQIKLLEERVGTALFRREKGRVILTETGRRVAPMVSGAFDNLDDAFAIARTDSESVLTISCSNTFAANWMAIRLGSFQMQRPKLAVRLHTSDEVIDFARDEIDCAIRSSIEPWPGLVSHFLMRIPIAPLASPAFLAEHPPITCPADVMRLPRMSPDDTWWTSWFGQVADGAPPKASGLRGVRLDSQIMDGNAAIAGQGIAILNPSLWRFDLRAGRLVQPLPDMAFGRRCYWLVYPDHRRTSPKIRAFREWLLEEVAKEAAEDEHDIYRRLAG